MNKWSMGRWDLGLSGDVVGEVNIFKYVGSFIQNNGNFDEEVKHMIKCGWIGEIEAFGVLSGKTVSMRLIGKFYENVVRLTMLYGSKFWMVE